MNVALAWSRDAKLAAEMAAEVAAFWMCGSQSGSSVEVL
jgi:hypothetical protein